MRFAFAKDKLVLSEREEDPCDLPSIFKLDDPWSVGATASEILNRNDLVILYT